MGGTKGRAFRSKTCHICQKSYTRHQALKDHLNAHQGEKAYKCDFCAEAFTRQHDCRVHEREQHGDCPMFICRDTVNGVVTGCGRAFSRKFHLRRHRHGATIQKYRSVPLLALDEGEEIEDIEDIDRNDVVVDRQEDQGEPTIFARYGSWTTSSLDSLPASHTNSSPMYQHIDAYYLLDHFDVTRQAVQHCEHLLSAFIVATQPSQQHTKPIGAKSTSISGLIELHIALSGYLRNLLGHCELIPGRLCANALFTIDAALWNNSALEFDVGLVKYLLGQFDLHGNQHARQSSHRVVVVGMGMWTSVGRHYLPLDYLRWLQQRPDLYNNGTLVRSAVGSLKLDLNAFDLEFF